MINPRLLAELELGGITLKEYFNHLRFSYLNAIRTSPKRVFIERVLGKNMEELLEEIRSVGKSERLDQIASEFGDDWSSVRFHQEHALETGEELSRVFPQISVDKVISSGYKLSLMPLPLAVDNAEWLSKIIPKPDFFAAHPAKKSDPYGIFEKGIKKYRDGHYLGSQKFLRSFLMNITSMCPHGCVDCYKGVFTRVRGKEFFTELEKAVSVQSKLLVEYLNENPLIQTVIVSGGEPLLLEDSGIKEMLTHFTKAKYLAEFRICTGTIFQGEPFRIGTELLESLKKFEEETGIRVHFNTHVNHPSQFTPESLLAVDLVHQYDFSINTQIPLQEGVNVFREDYKKTMNTLYRLAELQGRSGVRPYKYILHMNSGSLDYSVPLEFMLKVLGELKYRTDHPLPETWQPVSMSILCSEGNILLSPQMNFGLKKEVVQEEGYVEYHIPVPEGEGFKFVQYREPLMQGFNDKPFKPLNFLSFYASP